MTAPHPPTSASHVDGAIPLGDYALAARVDRRAAADVYAATHVPTGEPRLVYVLHAAAAQDNPLVHQVVCEIDAARWLRHPATAKVDAHGETPTGAPYVAVQRPRGRTLAQVLAAGERPGRRRFVRLANRLVEALDEAHAVGLVHGRLTPHALVVGDERDEFDTPQLTITGFGVAALAHDGPIGPEERSYVAPEVQAGGEATDRSDVFALASVLHHLLVGVAPGAPGATGARGPAAAGAGAGPHASAVAVLAAARAADPAHRSRSVKAFWEELVAALVDDAAAVDASAAPAPVAAAAPERTSGAVAVRTLLEQLEHERRQGPRADAAKAMLLSPMPGVPAPMPGVPAPAPTATPVPPAAPGAWAADATGAPPVAVDPWAAPPPTATGSAALAALAAFSAPAAPAPAPTAPGATPPAVASAPPPPSAPAQPDAPPAPVPRRSRPAPVAWSDELPPERAIPERPPARSRARIRPRPGFLLAVSVGAPLAFLAVINWPGPIDAAPLVDPDPPAVIAIRAAMAVDAAKERRARQAMSGRVRAADADVEPAADGLPVDTLPVVAPIVIPLVEGLEMPAVRAPGAAPVGREEFRRLRVAAPDSLR